MRFQLFAVGAIALLGQVVLLRECEVAFFGSELVLVLGLGAWLLGSAAGAAPGRGAQPPGGRAVRWLFVALGLLLPLAVVFARGVRILFGGVPGAYLPFGLQLLTLALCLVPVSLLLGLLFQWTARRFIATGRSPASAYALESAGGLLGGLLATLLPAAGLQNLGAVLLCGVAAIAATWPGSRASGAPAGHPPKAGRGSQVAGRGSLVAGRRSAAAAGLFLALALLIATPALDRGMTRWNHPDLLATRDTPYGRVTVTGMLGQIVVFENDALAYESQGTAAEEFVQLAAIQRDTVNRVLVLAGAAQGLVAELLRRHPARVDDVELDARLLALVEPQLPDPQRLALADPRVHLAFADPRRFLDRAPAYDLILIGLPEPESGRTNRFYTREFFAACAAHLAPGGVLALRLRSAENLWTPVLARRTASIHRALREVFPATAVLPGTTNLLFASRAPLERDPAVLGGRLRALDPGTRLVTPAYVRYLYANDRFAEIARRLADTPALANRDARPICYQTTMMLWLARFFPSLARLDLPEADARTMARTPGVWAAAAALGLAFLLARRRAALRRVLLAAAAGCAGMLLESALLLDYQTRSGVLYQDLGVLLMAFMGGLALGAWALERLVRRIGCGRLAGALTFATLAVLGLACAALLRAGAGGGLAGSAAMLFACGFLVAAAFAFAVLHGAPDGGAVIGPVYAADLLGGCAGSLVAGLVAIPMLGLPATAALAAALALVALLAI
jgi:spermidine synthase